MRNELLGYLLGALESDEQALVESELANDHQLRGEMELLRRSLVPLKFGANTIEPPHGLAARVVDFVFMRSALDGTTPAPDAAAVELPAAVWRETAPPNRKWRMADVSVAAGIVVAALSVVVPAIIQSRANAERLACQERLQTAYAGIASFAGLHNGKLPVAVPSEGFEGKAGIYAPVLRNAGYLQDSESVVCPGSKETTGDCRVTLEQLRAAHGRELQLLVRRMGGTYAFAIGYRENGKYRPLILHIGAKFPLMADLPGENGKPIGHHGACGRNVLTADGVAHYIVTPCWEGKRDHNIFTNNAGELDAGADEYDNVLMPSDNGPSFDPNMLQILNVDR